MIESTKTGHPIIDDLCRKPADLFAVKEHLARIIVFGPWQEGTDRFERPEPGPPESRVTVWLCDGKFDLEQGWYYRVGFGVCGIAGFSNREPFETSEKCRAAVDEILRDTPGVFLV